MDKPCPPLLFARNAADLEQAEDGVEVGALQLLSHGQLDRAPDLLVRQPVPRHVHGRQHAAQQARHLRAVLTHQRHI